MVEMSVCMTPRRRASSSKQNVNGSASFMGVKKLAWQQKRRHSPPLEPRVALIFICPPLTSHSSSRHRMPSACDSVALSCSWFLHPLCRPRLHGSSLRSKSLHVFQNKEKKISNPASIPGGAGGAVYLQKALCFSPCAQLHSQTLTLRSTLPVTTWVFLACTAGAT